MRFVQSQSCLHLKKTSVYRLANFPMQVSKTQKFVLWFSLGKLTIDTLSKRKKMVLIGKKFGYREKLSVFLSSKINQSCCHWNKTHDLINEFTPQTFLFFESSIEGLIENNLPINVGTYQEQTFRRTIGFWNPRSHQSHGFLLEGMKLKEGSWSDFPIRIVYTFLQEKTIEYQEESSATYVKTHYYYVLFLALPGDMVSICMNESQYPSNWTKIKSSPSKKLSPQTLIKGMQLHISAKGIQVQKGIESMKQAAFSANQVFLTRN